MKLTEAEKIAIEKAFVDIESGIRFHSCSAVSANGGAKLAIKYAKFFSKSPIDLWGLGDLSFEQIKQARLMLLATFYVLEGEI